MKRARQLIPYNFGVGGMDQRTDDRFVPLGRPKDLRNIRFPKQAKISRRGQWGTPTGTAATAVILKKMFAVGDGGLLGYGIDAAGTRNWYTYEPSTGTTISAGTAAAVPRAWIKRTPLRNLVGSPLILNTFSTIDVAHGTSQSCYVATRAGFLEWWIVDEKTERVLASGNTNGTIAVAVASGVRVLAVPASNTFVIAIGDTGSANLRICTVSVTSALTVRDTIATKNTSDRWDWAMYTSNLYVANHDSATATRVVLRKYDTGTWAAPSSANIDLGVAPLAVGVVVPYSGASTRITVLAHEGTNGLRGVSYSSALAVTTALWVIDATTTTVNKIGAAERSDNTVEVFAEQNNASTPLILVNQYNVTIGAAATANAINNARLVSKPIVPTTSYRAFVMIGYTSNDALQHSLFLFESNNMVGRYAMGAWAGLIAGSHLPNLQAFLDSGAATTKFFGVALLFASRLVANQGNRTDTGVFGAWFDLDPAAGLAAVDDENTKLISGGFLSLFDGDAVVENGFLLAPEILSATGGVGGGSLMPANGTFLFKAVFSWIDSRGRVHRSAASQPFTGTTGGGQNQVTIVVRGMAFTRKSLCLLELYRTTNGGTTYQLETVTTIGNSASVSVVSLAADTTLTAKAPLYQQGTILGNQQPSCPNSIASTGRRLMAGPGDDLQGVTEGKQRVEGEGASFFETIERRITRGGDICALTTSGERWIAFKKRSFYFAAGEGADDGGQGDSLTEFEQFSNDVGCTQPQTIVETTYGTVFRSERGFYLLGRDGGLVYLGAGVEDEVGTAETGAVITDATYDKDSGTILFQTSGTECFVLTLFPTETGYDWRWSVDDSVDFVGIAFAGGRLYASRNTSTTTPIQRYEPTGTYAGGTGQTFTMRVRTGWIHIAGTPQGRGRIYNVQVIGRASATAQVTCQIAYDLDETLTQSEVADSAIIGTDAFQWQYETNQRRVEAVLLDLSQNAAVAGGDVELNQLVLEVTPQPGRFRLPSNKHAT